MTYDEAEEKALNMKWKVGTCSQGEECWCRTILPVEEVIMTGEGVNDTSYMIVGPAEMYAKVAHRIVYDHNRLIDFWDENE